MTDLMNLYTITFDAFRPLEVCLRDGLGFEIETLLFLIGICFGVYSLPLLLVLLSESTIVPIGILLNKQDVSPKGKNNAESMNLVYRSIFTEAGFKLFIYDDRDPRGVNINALFVGKAYRNHVWNGSNGFICNRSNGSVVPGPNGTDLVKLPALTVAATAVEARGVRILSNNTPIARQVKQSNTNFFIEQE